MEHVVNVIVGKEDLMKVCQQEEQCKRFSSAWIRDKQNILPKAPFFATRDYVWSSGMKSHKWKQVFGLSEHLIFSVN